MKNLSLLLPALFLVVSSTGFGHGVSDADKQAMISGGLPEYLWLGASHMLTGYDHLLFIFGVIFFLTKFSDIVKFITAFTLGHCITLIFATLMEITANYYLVDAVIALTVVYKGFDNIDGFRKYLKINPPNMLFLVFVFGLIHGFGLSTRLQELPLGHEGLLLKILSFNVGVELGQIAALTVMLVLLSGWRKTASFAKFSFGANVGLMIAGFFLFAGQMMGFVQDSTHRHEQAQRIERFRQRQQKSGHGHSHGHGHGHGHSHGGHSHDHGGHSNGHGHDHQEFDHPDGHKHEH